MICHRSLAAITLTYWVISQSPLIAQTNIPKGSAEVMTEWITYTGNIADIDSSLKITHYSVSQCKQLINQLYQIDQRYRDSVMNGSKSREKQDYFWRKIKANDSANQALLTKIVTRYGWPTIHQYGEHESFTAWLIVWHADRDYQRKYYPLIKQAYQRGTIKTSYLELYKRLNK
ncbi:hypothetical protein GO755_35985 [Spirosoma sp. HMF4905]|uniref:Uncharacterized protein n=1 Tax=Spirosoma arboris TaxID=2682092 RepID=A0A7K1SNU7_9BACT|nr:hypothetical protein [Spirosoma arboris]MVM35478.1 hypothetical protein [Spirosoma arboris]